MLEALHIYLLHRIFLYILFLGLLYSVVIQKQIMVLNIFSQVNVLIFVTGT